MVKVSFGLSLCWVECLWAAWTAAAVHAVNMVLKPSTLDREQRDTLTTAAHVYSGYSEILHTRFSLPRVVTLKIITVINCFILTFALEMCVRGARENTLVW